MSRSPLFFAGALLVVFIAGVMAGDYLASGSHAPQPGDPGNAKNFTPSAGDPDWSEHELEEAGLRSHATDLERQLADLKAKEDSAILNDRLAFYKTYKFAPESFGDDLQVTKAMASFLKMSAAERKNVEGHLAQIHAQVQALEKQHLKQTAQTDNSVTYEIEPFPEGAALKDQLKQLVEDDLGTDRGDLFLNSAAWEMNSSFASFGAGKTGLQITRIDQSGPPSYRIVQTFANGSSMEEGTSTVVPAAFNGLVQLDQNP